MPRVRPTGGIFWRADASGNLVGYDPAGTIRAKIVNGVFSAVGNTAALSPLTSVASSSATLVSSGPANSLSITPQVSTSVFVLLTCGVSNATPANGIQINLYWTTGAVPAAGSAVVGTSFASVLLSGAGTATLPNSASLSGKATGLTVGTATNFYFAFASASGTSITFAGTGSLFGEEI